MTDPPQDGAGADREDPSVGGAVDRTREIKLPPLPARPRGGDPEGQPPAPVTPAEQPPPPGSLADQPTDQLRPPAGPARQDTLAFGPSAADEAGPGNAAPGPATPGPVTAGEGAPDQGAPGYRPPGHGAPAHDPVGYRPAGASAVPEPPGAPGRGRAWPWVLLALLPLVVIVGAGVLLFLLLRGV
jgi:hypothetical protein